MRSIDIDHEGILNEFRAVKIGGMSSSVCLTAVVIIIVLIMCRKKCRTNRMNESGVNVSVNLEKNDEKAMLESEARRQEERMQKLFPSSQELNTHEIANETSSKQQSINQFK